MVLVGQVLRSAAMIHASTNFSHNIAHHKPHRLVTDGVYRSESFHFIEHVCITSFNYVVDGFAIHHMLDIITWHLELK